MGSLSGYTALMGRIVQRALKPPALGRRSLLLWGPRKTGKSLWLRQQFLEGFWIDLLQTDAFAKHATPPTLLRERLPSDDASILRKLTAEDLRMLLG